mmetsp:Transcript_9066/g.10472  ORF Transcript_9066/g.10472 Transcript_9066/m.10472 type:complete len:284 (-) Transcript_9066:298-1149(-)
MTCNANVFEKELRVIFFQKGFNIQTETTKTIRKSLFDRLGMQSIPSELKGVFKDLIVQLVNEQQQMRDKEEDGESSEQSEISSEHDDSDSSAFSEKLTNRKQAKKNHQKTFKRKRNSSLPASNVARSDENRDLKILYDLGKAMRVGPTLYRGLKDLSSDLERTETLTIRLKKAGASWKGRLPCTKDVENARKKRSRMDDMDGLDTSLILDNVESSGRKRRSRSKIVNYSLDDEELDEHDDCVGDDQNQDSSGKQIESKNEKSASDSDDDVEFDDEDSSEDEFE